MLQRMSGNSSSHIVPTSNKGRRICSVNVGGWGLALPVLSLLKPKMRESIHMGILVLGFSLYYFYLQVSLLIPRDYDY